MRDFTKSNCKCNVCGKQTLLDIITDFKVMGGFESTPGNGFGCLDDMSEYKFKVCEFCLDYIFSKMVIPPEVHHDSWYKENYIPAQGRIMKENKWRKNYKKYFFFEWNARNKARKI